MRMTMAFIAGLLLSAAPAAAQPADGKAVYEKNCASCHGADGKGNAQKEKVLKLEPGSTNLGRDAVAGQSKDEKKTITTDGKGKMPAYGKKLSQPEIDAVSEYTMQLIAAIRGK
jgi:mono/diheme cytochrome c family protein